MATKRLTGFRFQNDATVANLQPMLNAVAAALRGDRAHALCHPCFYFNQEEGVKNLHWFKKIQFVHWSSWCFNVHEEGTRAVTALVSFDSWCSPKKRALIQWIERSDGSTLSFSAHFGSLKEVVMQMDEFTYKLYLKQTQYISWEPTAYNASCYEDAIAEAEKEGNTGLANQLANIHIGIKHKLAQLERVQDENEEWDSPWWTYNQNRALGFSLMEVVEEPCECEDYTCATKEKTLYCTPKVEGNSLLVDGQRFQINEHLFHNILLHGLKRGTKKGVFRVGAYDFPFIKNEDGTFQIKAREAILSDLNAEGETLWNMWSQGWTPLYLGVAEQEYSGHCDPEYCSNHFCGDEKYLYEFGNEGSMYAQLNKSYKLSYLYRDDAPKKEEYETTGISAFERKQVREPLSVNNEEQLALLLLAAGTDYVKRRAFIVGDWCYPVLIQTKDGKRSYTIQKRVARGSGKHDLLYWF